MNLGGGKGVVDGAALRLKRPVTLRHPVTRAPVKDWLPIGTATVTSAGDKLAMAVLDPELRAQVAVGDIAEIYVEREETAPPPPPPPKPTPDDTSRCRSSTATPPPSWRSGARCRGRASIAASTRGKAGCPRTRSRRTPPRSATISPRCARSARPRRHAGPRRVAPR